MRLAFNGDPQQLEAFVQLIKDFVPENTGVVLRGSAVTGCRWKDGAPFDSDGPGTSDLDLTLVGHRILEYLQSDRLLRARHTLTDRSVKGISTSRRTCCRCASS